MDYSVVVAEESDEPTGSFRDGMSADVSIKTGWGSLCTTVWTSLWRQITSHEGGLALDGQFPLIEGNTSMREGCVHELSIVNSAATTTYTTCTKVIITMLVTY